MKEIIMTLGLPCSGKSSWAKENVPEDYLTISADEIKKGHDDYDPDNVTWDVHQFSVEAARDELFHAIKQYKNIFFDSGSINNKYSLNILTRIQTQYPEYVVRLVWIKTPYEVCLKRNAQRERKVPETAITDKAAIEVANFYKLKPYTFETVIVDYFTNKHRFYDMDGVLAAQTTLPIINGEIDFVNGEIHRWQKPVEQVINQLMMDIANGTKVYILSASANSFCNEQKIAWLNEHVPYFRAHSDRIFFVNQGKHKAEMLENLVRKLKLNKKDVTLVDDFHATLYDVKRRGMNAMHVSEILTQND